MAVTVTRELARPIASKNDSYIQVQTDQSGAFIRMEFWSTLPSGPGTKVISMDFPVDAAGKASVNVKRVAEAMGIVGDYLRPSLPSFNQTTITEASGPIKFFYLKISDVNATTGSVISTTTTTNYSVMLAGINFDWQHYTSRELINFIVDGTKRRWLTWQPQTKLVRKDQQEYLYYYHDGFNIGNNLRLKYQLFYTDGTSSAATDKFVQSFATGKIYIIPVGYGQMNLAAVVDPLKTLSYYTVWLYSDSNTAPVTTIRTYDMDDRCFPGSKYLLFLNSISGMDTIRVIQNAESGLKTSAETAEHQQIYFNVDADPSILPAGQFYDYQRTGQRSHKVVTDLYTLETRLYLQELFMSTNVFEVKNGRFLPIKIVTDSLSLDKGSAALQSIAFEYRYQFEDNSYHPETLPA
jgi:hypothetical protein